MMRNCSLDLETLGTAPGSALLSIGACMFDADGTGPMFYAVLGTGPQFTHGATVSEDTRAWWDRQSPEAREVLEQAGEAMDTEVQLRRFVAWWDAQGARYPWSRGANFDPPLLEATLEMFGLSAPWKFYDVRCERTLTALFPHIKAPEFQGTRHRADADAAHQALHVSAILRHTRHNELGVDYPLMPRPLDFAMQDDHPPHISGPSGAEELRMGVEALRSKGLSADAAAPAGLATDRGIEDLGTALARIRKEKT